MQLRRPGRFLAPLALAAAAVAVLWTVQTTIGDEAKDTARTEVRSSTDAKQSPGRTKTRVRNRRRRLYVVKAGDTLLAIADKTEVPVEQLIRLNPKVDPQSLRTGQRLKLTQ